MMTAVIYFERNGFISTYENKKNPCVFIFMFSFQMQTFSRLYEPKHSNALKEISDDETTLVEMSTSNKEENSFRINEFY